MEVTKIVPKSTINKWVVKPIIIKELKIGETSIEFINRMDIQRFRATEGVVVSVPKTIKLDAIAAMRLGMVDDFPDWDPSMSISGESTGVKPGDIIGYHYLEVDTLELDEDEYLFVDGSRVIYSRNEEGITPLMGWALMSKVELPEQTDGGIYRVGKHFAHNRYKIVATGMNCPAEIGDEVMLDADRKSGKIPVITTWIDGKEYTRASQDRIIAKYE